MVCAADWARHHRAGRTEARRRTRFLERLCPADYLQLPMMADAADETLALLRYFDDDEGAAVRTATHA
eukprot:4269538-Lingulodinium_polyedra.AAC.1